MHRIGSHPLWIGHAGDVRDPRRLPNLDATALVDLALEEAPVHTPREFVYCRFPLVDGPGNAPNLLDAAVGMLAALLRARTPTLVSCGMGLSRAPAVAAAALALVTGRAPEECLEEVHRSTACDVHPALWQEVRAAWGRLGGAVQ
jgi:protein-tyrosine phosphatase